MPPVPVSQQSQVLVLVPATADATHLLRATAQSLARGEFDVDRLDDLVLAIGVAAFELIRLDGAANLAMTVDGDGGHLDVTLSVDGPARPGWPEHWERSLSRRVVAAVATNVTAHSGIDGDGISFRSSS